MADDLSDLTRREALLYSVGFAVCASGFVPQIAIAQEEPKGPPLKLPYTKDLSTPQTTVDTLYAAVKAGDLDGLQEIVTPNFFFRRGTLQPEERSVRDELIALLYLVGPSESTSGEHVIQRQLGNWIGNPVSIYAPPLTDGEITFLKKGYPPFSSASEVDDFNKMKNIAIARVSFAHNLALGEKAVARSDVTTFFGLKKEKDWKVFSAQPYFRGHIDTP